VSRLLCAAGIFFVKLSCHETIFYIPVPFYSFLRFK
jgi:hypothetical protein